MADQKLEQTSPIERYKKNLELIERERIFILLSGDSAEQVFDAFTELKEGGDGLLCIDFKVTGVAERMKSIKRRGGVCPGVFSVSTAKDARRAINSGAEFLFTTHLDKALSKKCRREKVFHAAGALTPKEVYEARQEGADAVSVYPSAAMGGVGFIALLNGMFPAIKLIPTDRMDASDAEAYINAGAYSVAALVDARNTQEARDLLQVFSK